MDRVSRVVALAAMACLLSPTAHAAALNDTGQITCFNATATSTGSVSIGDPAPEAAGFAGQDCSLGASAADAVGAQVKIGGASVPGRDYSKIANDGSELPDTANLGSAPGDWGCTRDNVSGLIWELRPDDGSLRDRNHRFSWKNVSSGEPNTCGGQVASCNTDAYVAAINTTGHCGASDWRLPTPAQLEGLLAYADPAATRNLIDRSWFPDQAFDEVLLQHVFWSDSAADTGNLAWATDFDFGLSAVTPRENAAFVRLVRAAAAPATPRFSTSDPQSSGEIVVRDAYTGLQWKQCPQGLSGASCTGGTLASLTWSNALASAAAESFAGASDWRLPNIIELASIRDYTPVVFPAVALSAEFAGTASNDAHWSSTNDPRPDSLANAYTYTYGESTAHNPASKTAQPAAVRLVRGGNFLAAHVPGADTTPNALVFNGKSAPAGSLVESDPITVTGITGPTSLKATGAAQSAFSINGGSWGSGIGAVINGQTVRVRHLAAATVGALATTTLTIGGTSGSFNSTASATAPGIPTGVTATRGNASATVTFSAPASDGGSAITAYTALSNPGGGGSSCTITPPLSCTITGLINGQVYTFTIRATNVAGTSAPSAPTNAVTPATTPSAPTAVTANAGLGQATVSFAVPVSTGGEAITGYTATSSPGGASGACAASPCTVAGLTNGQSYRFTVTASNVVGTGAASAESNLVTLPGLPGAPTGVTATGSNGQATVSFTTPASNGGSAILDYTATSSPGVLTGTCGASPCAITGLAGGTAYTFTVRARNAVGSGAASAPSSPLALLSAPTISFSGTPRAEIPLNHKAGFLLFGGNPEHVLRVADADSATLTVTVSSSNPSLLPINPVAFGPGIYLLRASGTSNTWNGTLKPVGNESGSATLTYTVTDTDGLTASVQILVTVLGNRTPFATYSTQIIRGAMGAAGDYQLPGFLTSASPGEGEELTQIVAHQFYSSPDLINFSIDASGTLRFTLTEDLAGSNGRLILTWPIDNGTPAPPCVGDREQRLSFIMSWGFSIGPNLPPGCGQPSIVSLTDDNYYVSFKVARRVQNTRLRAKQLPQLAYSVTFKNSGALMVEGAMVTIPAPTHLGNPQWTCTVPVGACVPASGTGPVSTVINLDLDEEGEIVFTGSISDTTRYITLSPSITFAQGVDGNVFGNGVERVDVVSDSHVFVGGFEGRDLEF